MKGIFNFFHTLITMPCLHCRKAKAISPEYLFCPDCAALLHIVDKSHVCAFCAQPLVSEFETCLDCRNDPPAYASLHCEWWYDGAGRTLLQAFKFGGEAALGHVLVKPLEKYLAGLPASDLATLCPVPSSPGAKRLRGYNGNQLVLAKLNSKRWQNLFKRSPGHAQKSLNRQERRINLDGKLKVCHSDPTIPPWVILIDDVHTTGATMRACSQLLLDAGVGRVDAFCWFRD